MGPSPLYDIGPLWPSPIFKSIYPLNVKKKFYKCLSFSLVLFVESKKTNPQRPNIKLNIRIVTYGRISLYFTQILIYFSGHENSRPVPHTWILQLKTACF